MSRRWALARRTATEWSVRALLAIIVAVIGYYSVGYTLGYTLKFDPVRGHVLAAGDGRVTARLSQSFLKAGVAAADLDKAERLGRLALQRDPTAVQAAGVLGLVAQIRGDTQGARRLFAYAEALSRRDLQTQLWSIEDAVGRNDIPGALRHYDIALRTIYSAPDLLFPVLASAVSDPAIRSELVRTLATHPVWGPNFITYAAYKADPRAMVRLLVGLRAAGVPISDEVRAAVIEKLITSEAFEDAWNYYRATDPKADRRMSRDPHFTANLAIPTPFDWTPVNAGDTRGDIQRGERGGVFDFSAPASIGGPVLQQVQMLPPGSYQIEGHSAGIDQPEGSRPYWALVCRSGSELGRTSLPNSAQADGRFAGTFTVPASCPVQVLMLILRPSDAMAGLSGQIDLVQLTPAR